MERRTIRTRGVEPSEMVIGRKHERWGNFGGVKPIWATRVPKAEWWKRRSERSGVGRWAKLGKKRCCLQGMGVRTAHVPDQAWQGDPGGRFY